MKRKKGIALVVVLMFVLQCVPMTALAAPFSFTSDNGNGTGNYYGFGKYYTKTVVNGEVVQEDEKTWSTDDSTDPSEFFNDSFFNSSNFGDFGNFGGFDNFGDLGNWGGFSFENINDATDEEDSDIVVDEDLNINFADIFDEIRAEIDGEFAAIEQEIPDISGIMEEIKGFPNIQSEINKIKTEINEQMKGINSLMGSMNLGNFMKMDNGFSNSLGSGFGNNFGNGFGSGFNSGSFMNGFKF